MSGVRMREETPRSTWTAARSKANPKPDAEWVSRGIISACECFSCANKVAHRLRGVRVSILCMDPCRYRPLKGETRPSLEKMPDIEQIA